MPDHSGCGDFVRECRLLDLLLGIDAAQRLRRQVSRSDPDTRSTSVLYLACSTRTVRSSWIAFPSGSVASIPSLYLPGLGFYINARQAIPGMRTAGKNDDVVIPSIWRARTRVSLQLNGKQARRAGVSCAGVQETVWNGYLSRRWPAKVGSCQVRRVTSNRKPWRIVRLSAASLAKLAETHHLCRVRGVEVAGAIG